MDKNVSRLVHILDDFSVGIDVVYAEMKYQRKRLNWTKEDLRDYCIAKYNQRHFLSLNDEQIRDLCFYLDSLLDNAPMPYKKTQPKKMTIKSLTLRKRKY